MVEIALAENGRVGVVVPHGVLFRGGSEGLIRQKLIEENLLDAIIGLPSNLFFGTGIPAAILLFRKDRTNTDVLFVDASSEFEDIRNQNRLTADHINKVVSTYQGRQEIAKYSHLADFAELESNEFNLNIPRYVDTYEEEKKVDVEKVQQDLECLTIDLTKVQAKMASHLKELGI